MALSTPMEVSTGRQPRADRPPVPECGRFAVSTLNLAERVITHVGGPEGVQDAMDACLHALVLRWVKAAKVGPRVRRIDFLSRKDFDKTLPEDGVLMVCRDSARMGCGTPGVVEAVYAQVRAARKSWRPKYVYASGIKNDRRQQVLALLGVPESDVIGADRPEWAAVADFGTALHELTEGWLKDLGVSRRSEFQARYSHPRRDKPDEKEIIVSGRVDHEVEVDGGRYILDVKTVGRKDFDAGAHGHKFEGYHAQLNVYGRTLFLEDHVERNGIVLLVCRDSGRMLDVIVNLTEDAGKDVLLRARAIMRCVAERRLPTGEKFGFEAGFNPYKSLCALQDRTGLVQRALDEGVEPSQITIEYLLARYGK